MFDDAVNIDFVKEQSGLWGDWLKNIDLTNV